MINSLLQGIQSKLVMLMIAFVQRMPLVETIREMANDVGEMSWRVRKLYEIEVDQARQAILSTDYCQHPLNLNRHEFRVLSQGGEDGIIQEIFRRIGTQDRFFVEIGAGNGHENNTAFLLHHGWQGCWIEGKLKHTAQIWLDKREYIENGDLRVKQSFVTAENSESLLKELAIAATFDLLSIDVDQNTWWVWNALGEFRPRVVVIEYKPHFPPAMAWKVEYDATQTSSVAVHYHVFQIYNNAIIEESKETHNMRYFFQSEMAFFMRTAGLELIHICEFMNPNKAVSQETWNVTVVARRVK